LASKKKRSRRHERRAPQPSRSTRGKPIAFAIVAVLALIPLLAVLIARGDGDGGIALVGDDPGPIHVHGLGVNPSDGALFVATHTGLYRVERGEPQPERIGEGQQDTMGFTVAGADHFLGSGHPDVPTAREKGWPPQLGLIESRDAGRTWHSVSLLGEADFHILRSVGERVYGFDVTSTRLLASGDSGKTWQERTLPALLVDLVAHPADAGRLIASTPEGLALSSDDGRSWTALADVAGLLAWPAPERLYLVRGDGAVFASDDGRAWTRRGSVDGEPAAFMVDDDALFVALHDGTIERSQDGGRSWRVYSTPSVQG
jgi:hypothetical protein